MTEVGRLGKMNGAVALTESSGGRKLSFATLRALEKAIGRVGEELHSQYLLSYTPPGRQAGLHTITVKVKDRPDAEVRARPAYWPDEQ